MYFGSARHTGKSSCVQTAEHVYVFVNLFRPNCPSTSFDVTGTKFGTIFQLS